MPWLPERLTAKWKAKLPERHLYLVLPNRDGERRNPFRIFTLPGGTTVHAVDRDVFDRACRAAMRP